jgi:hypothetical protein
VNVIIDSFAGEVSEIAQAQVIEGTREQVLEQIHALPDNDVRYRVLLVPEEIDVEAMDEQERLRQIGRELFAQADAVEREPGEYDSTSDEAKVAEMVKEKYRRMGMRV